MQRAFLMFRRISLSFLFNSWYFWIFVSDVSRTVNKLLSVELIAAIEIYSRGSLLLLSTGLFHKSVYGFNDRFVHW